MTLRLNLGSAFFLVGVIPLLVGNRERCVVTYEMGGGGVGATVVITAILFHRLSFIKPDKLLKELLSDCCWYAARKQQSVSVCESITLLSCATEEAGRGEGGGLMLHWWRQQ